MNLLNDSPFVSGFILSAQSEAGFALTIIVKGTFEIRTDQAVAIAQAQASLTVSDEYYNTGQEPSSPRLESDFVPYKPRTDIVLVGRAYAPGQKPVASLIATLRVGQIKKSIAVFGDRVWYHPSKLSSTLMTNPVPFAAMELTYEKAYGGMDGKTGERNQANPVGRGFALSQSKESLHEKFLPNLESPDHLISSWDDRPKPVGFGFIGKNWQPRLQYVGTFDKRWERQGGLVKPKDFRFDFYNGAHPDLQVPGYLRGDEEVEMHHLTPEGHLRFRLPGMRPVIKVSRLKNSSPANEQPATEELPAREEKIAAPLDTLVFLPDEGIFYQVWRGLCPLRELSVEEISTIKIQMAQNEK
jgi:hypothetical protein